MGVGGGAGRGLENYKIFLDIICVTSLAYRGHRACLFFRIQEFKITDRICLPCKRNFFDLLSTNPTNKLNLLTFSDELFECV